MARIEYRERARGLAGVFTVRDWVAGASGAVLAMLVAVALEPANEAPEGENLPAVSAPVPILADDELVIDQTQPDPLGLLAPEKPVVYYQYLDETGRVRFANSLLQVPEEWRERAGRVELAGIPPQSPAEARMLRKIQQPPSGEDSALP